MEVRIHTGLLAPNFTLSDLDGALHSVSDFRGQVIILYFWSAECTWSERTDRQLISYLPAWGFSVALLAIDSNANENLELIEKEARKRSIPCVLLDRDHKVADLYGAQTTPHLFVIDMQGILQYQGAFDDVTFRKREPSQAYLREAVESLLAGELPNPAVTPPYGCAIVRFLANPGLIKD